MSLFKRNAETKVVELLKREQPPYAEAIPLRLDAVREELEVLGNRIDACNESYSGSTLKASARELHFIARRLLDALSGVDAGNIS